MKKTANLWMVLCALAFVPAAGGSEPDCSRAAGSRPDPARAPGTPDASIPVEHVFVVMQENHSFDNFLGRLNSFGYNGEVDGLTPEMSNPDGAGGLVRPYRLPSRTIKDTPHGWDASHRQWNLGANDGFVIAAGGADGARAMGYYEQKDLPLLYSLANRFAIGDRYFGSMLGPTWPNRYYLYSATSGGLIENKKIISLEIPTIFSRMSDHGVAWKYYAVDIPVLTVLRPDLFADDEQRALHFGTMKHFRDDLANGKLPPVVFLESSFLTGAEHPPFDFRAGQNDIADRLREILKSRYWKKAAIFITYDEHGGYFDHVPPPRACAPDALPPPKPPGELDRDGFARYGFRVPFIAVSPFAKKHYVSHVTYDHTSVLKFIETKFNLPALTLRDANADAMLDLFDFANPDYEYTVPGRPGS